MRVAILFLTAILLTGCAFFGGPGNSSSPVPADLSAAPVLQGENFLVNGWYDESPEVYGWNVALLKKSTQAQIIEIAESLASTKSGRRFMIFYNEDGIYGFKEPPSSLQDPPPLPVSENWVAIFDYVGNDLSVTWQK